MKQNTDSRQNSNTRMAQNMIEDFNDPHQPRNISNNPEVIETQQNLGMGNHDGLPLNHFSDPNRVHKLKHKHPKHYKHLFSETALPKVSVTKTTDCFNCSTIIMYVVFILCLIAAIVVGVLLNNEDVWLGLIIVLVIFYILYFIFTMIALADPRIKKTHVYLDQLNKNKQCSLYSSHYFYRGQGLGSSGQRHRQAIVINNITLTNLNIQKSIDYIANHQHDEFIWVDKKYEFVCEDEQTLNHIQSISEQVHQQYKSQYIGVRVNDYERVELQEKGKDCYYCCPNQSMEINVVSFFLVLIGLGIIPLMIKYCQLHVYEVRMIYKAHLTKKYQK